MLAAISLMPSNTELRVVPADSPNATNESAYFWTNFAPLEIAAEATLMTGIRADPNTSATSPTLFFACVQGSAIALAAPPNCPSSSARITPWAPAMLPMSSIVLMVFFCASVNPTPTSASAAAPLIGSLRAFPICTAPAATSVPMTVAMSCIATRLRSNVSPLMFLNVANNDAAPIVASSPKLVTSCSLDAIPPISSAVNPAAPPVALITAASFFCALSCSLNAEIDFPAPNATARAPATGPRIPAMPPANDFSDPFAEPRPFVNGAESTLKRATKSPIPAMLFIPFHSVKCVKVCRIVSVSVAR